MFPRALRSSETIASITIQILLRSYRVDRAIFGFWLLDVTPETGGKLSGRGRGYGEPGAGGVEQNGAAVGGAGTQVECGGAGRGDVGDGEGDQPG